jgi:glycosyltransferase involved in cell wall biosynthesis
MSSPTCVLFVTGAYFPEFSAGGLQSQAVARLLKGRAECHVLTTSIRAGLPPHDRVEDVAVTRVYVARTSRLSTALATVRMLVALIRLLPRVDVVHVQGFSTKNILVMALSKMAGRPVLLHLQTALYDEPATVRRQGRLAWWAFASADRYLSVSPGLTRHYLGANLDAAKVREIPNGVDETRFAPATVDERRDLRRRLHLPAEGPIVLFVGLISRDKQPQILLDAWIRLQPEERTASTLVFVGATDPAHFELGDRLIDRLQATVQLSGIAGRVMFVPPTSQVQDYFRAADVFVMPSLREGLPIALLEAMACGLPCVASRLPGATDVMIEDGINGRLVPPGDSAAFASALGELIANPSEAAAMGAAARRTVEERYTMKRVADTWLAAYEQVLAAK